MGRLVSFNFVTLDGFFESVNQDTNWHIHAADQSAWAEEKFQQEGILIFGRTTYELMQSYWTTEFAIENDPIVAEGMNNSEKLVFSSTLKKSDWNNTIIVRADMFEEIRKLKIESEKDMAILGSGSIVSQLADKGLIDEFQIVIDPVVLGDGNPLFKNLSHRIKLELTSHKIFKSGVVLLCYKPI